MVIMKLEQVLLIASITGSIYCKPKPQGENDRYAKIITNEYTQRNPNEYSFKFETTNGISVAELGQFEQTGIEEGNLVKTGYYHYMGTDNQYYLVTYIADKDGYRPTVYPASTRIYVPDSVPSYVPNSLDRLPMIQKTNILSAIPDPVPSSVSSVAPSSVPIIPSSSVSSVGPSSVPIVPPSLAPSVAPSTITTHAPTSAYPDNSSETDTENENVNGTTVLPEDEDRIGSKLLISLSGGGIGR